MRVIEQYSKYNYYDYNNPQHIVIHYVGAQSSTAKNNADYFCGGDRGASAHEFIDDNYCYKVVRENNGAWHIGNTRTEVNNRNSIGIEMCCMAPKLGVTAKTEANTIKRVVYYMNKYNIPIENLRTHYLVSGKRKICPNWSSNNWVRFENFKKKVEEELKNTSTTEEDIISNQINKEIIYRIKMANGEQIGAYRSLESAKKIAKINKCNVYRSYDNELIASYMPSIDPSNKPINYRVKTKAGQQLGAFKSYDNAVALAKNESAIIYDEEGELIKSYASKNTATYINLKPSVDSWRVYAVDGPYMIKNAVGALSPSKYGGLSYKILEVKAINVYKIKTKTFGIVAIYATKTGSATFTSKAKY